MKKLLSVLMFSIMVLSIVACGDASDDSDSEPLDAEIPQYSVQIGIDCISNLLFSKYDIDIYIDGEEIKTLEHGAAETLDMELEEGDHSLKITKDDDSSVYGEVTFTIWSEKSLFYKLSLSKNEIEIEEIMEEQFTSNDSDTTSDETTLEEKPEPAIEPENEVIEPVEDIVMTIDNSEELAAILATNNESDPLIKEFADKYEGRTIEFSGNVTYMTKHGNYDTRYDILLGAGDYDENSQQGPNFKLKNVSAYDLGLDTLFLEDVIELGKSLIIVAVLGEYNVDNTLYELDPISVKER